MVLTWAFTVPSTTNIRCAMSALDSPVASSVSTSRSRVVKAALPSPRRPPGQRATGQGGDHAGRDLGRQERGAVRDGVDAGEQFARVAGLEQEAAGAEAQGAFDVGVFAEGGQDDHADVGQQAADLGARG